MARAALITAGINHLSKAVGGWGLRRVCVRVPVCVCVCVRACVRASARARECVRVAEEVGRGTELCLVTWALLYLSLIHI